MQVTGTRPGPRGAQQHGDPTDVHAQRRRKSCCSLSVDGTGARDGGQEPGTGDGGQGTGGPGDGPCGVPSASFRSAELDASLAAPGCRCWPLRWGRGRPSASSQWSGAQLPRYRHGNVCLGRVLGADGEQQVEPTLCSWVATKVWKPGATPKPSSCTNGGSAWLWIWTRTPASKAVSSGGDRADPLS